MCTWFIVSQQPPGNAFDGATARFGTKWRPIPLIWAVVVGVARLYYGEHNMLDVVAGFAMGTMCQT